MSQDAFLPDGNTAKLPDYAMESTQEKLLAAFKKISKVNEKQLSAIEKLVKGAADAAQADNRHATEADNDRRDQLRALEELRDTTEESTDRMTASMDTLGSNLGKGASLLQQGASFLLNSALNLGNSLRSVVGSGAAFTDASGSAASLVTSLNGLGLTTSQATSLMGQFSGVVNTLGKGQFADIQKTFADLNNSGSKFGLSLAESSAILSEDLDTQKNLGMLKNLDARQNAIRSNELYESQLKSTKMLGISIDKIRESGKSFVDSNAQAQLSLISIGAKFPELAADLNKTFAETKGSFTAMGLSEEFSDQIMNMLVDPAAMASEAGKDMMIALQNAGSGGAKMAAEMQQIQSMMLSGNKDQIEAAKNRASMLDEQMIALAKNMSGDELEQFKSVLLGAGPMAREFALSIGKMRTASDNVAQDLESGQEVKLDPMAVAAAQFENTVGVMKGQVESFVNDIVSSFDFEQVTVLMNDLVGAMRDAGSTIRGFLGAGSWFTGTTVVGAMVAGIAALWAGAAIKKAMFSGISSLLGGGDTGGGRSVGGGNTGGGSALASAGKGIGQLGKGIGTGIGGILKGFAMGLRAFANPAILLGATILSGSIAIIGAGIAGASFLLSKAMPILAEGFKSFQDLDGDALKAAGIGMVALGAGLAAFGAGSVMGAMGNIVGGILDGITSMFGGSTPFDKMEEFGKMDFDTEKIKANAEAMVAFGSAMASAGAGQAAGGASAIVSAIGDFFGGETPFEQMRNFSEETFDHAAILANAETVSAFSAAIGGIGAIDGSNFSDITDNLEDFGEAIVEFQGLDLSTIAQNASILPTIAKGYAAFNEIDGTNLKTVAVAIDQMNRSIARAESKTIEQVFEYAGKMTTAKASSAPPSPVNIDTGTNSSVLSKTTQSAVSGRDDMISILKQIRDNTASTSRTVKKTGADTADAIRESW